MISNDEIEALVQQREAARKARDWARADAIREQLRAIRFGSFRVAILDEPQGPFWYWTTERAASSNTVK